MKKYFILCFILLQTLHGANWVMLQGTEKKVGHHPWGFFQLQAEHNDGEIVLKSGINKTPFSYAKPTLQNQTEFQVARARVGIRGSFDDANNVNYFVLTEVAQNGVNAPLGYTTPTYLIDASLTFKYLPIYVRIGMFKYAGSEEGNMARFVSPFINFTTLSNQMMLERYVEESPGKPTHGVGAYRDSGIELFKEFSLYDSSRFTLAYMLGNGSGTAKKNVNANHFTHYGYASYEYLFGRGKGYKKESLKFYLWGQDGKRLFRNALYDRTRYGSGITFYKSDLRLEAEYMAGSGMIMSGVKDLSGASGTNAWQYLMHPESNNKSDGYYLLSSYAILKTLDIIARYDVYNRLSNATTDFRVFKTTTLGASYRFDGYNRVDINYAVNDISAPKNSVADAFLNKTVGNLLSFQFTMVFK